MQVASSDLAKENTARLITALAALVFSVPARADWPTYRGDAARSGYATNSVNLPLNSQWTYRTTRPLDPAWPRSDRQTFDWSLQPVIADAICYFGEPTSGAIHALDLATGRHRWTFYTGGPVRLAPVIYEHLLIAASDDGFLYALDRNSGQEIWRHRGGPDHSLRLGNQRMISRWPVRGGPLVKDDKLYYAAGIWPSDGIYLYALDAKTGREIWANEDAGSIYMPQPHGGAEAESGVAAQGHLAAIDDGDNQWLLVPTGRAVPAVFDRRTGAFKYFHLQKFGQKGGAAVAANERFFFNSGMIFDLTTGLAAHTIGDSPVALPPDGLVAYVDRLLTRYAWQEVDKVDRKGVASRVVAPVAKWSVPDVPQPSEIVVAGDSIFVGVENEVLAIDGQDQSIAWRAAVDGRALAMAVATDAVLVATDKGVLHCFSSRTGDPGVVSSPSLATSSDSATDAQFRLDYSELAAEILSKSHISRGYCLDLGCGDGGLTEALVAHSDLHVVAVDDDAQRVAELRRHLAERDLLGSRVTVIHANDLRDSGLPNYFANLALSQRQLAGEENAVPNAELERLTRPYGGVHLSGPRSAWQANKRGPLAGAGQWTHQYSTPGNSTCSTDEHIRGALGMLWFRDFDMDMPQRHGRGPGPLFYDGLLYSLGLNELACVDAYNGFELWRYPLPSILAAYDGDELMGTAGTHSPYCIADSGIYVRFEGQCLRIDRRTGQLLEKFQSPADTAGQPGVWGYIACVDGVLIGSLADPEHVVTFRYLNRGGDMSALLTESKTLFAMDATNGQLLWRFDAAHSIRHNAIAVDGSSVFLIDRPQAAEDRTKNAKVEKLANGALIALDTHAGVQKWRNEQSIDGTLLALAEQHPVLLMASQPTRFALASEIAEHLTAFDPRTGQQLWRQDARYSSRPMINGRTIYSEGGSWDLISGSPMKFDFKRSYGCGLLVGSKYSMVFRSATLGYHDFARPGQIENYGGVRPGCWINAIPAGGLVLMPDASAGCVCSYLNQAWFALEGDGSYPPTMQPAGGVHDSKVTVEITTEQPDDSVRYTLDGSTPTANSTLYQSPIELDKTTKVKARTFSPDGRPGRTIQHLFSIKSE